MLMPLAPVTSPTTQTPLGLLAVFGAGIASFLAPCVLPLVPGYLSFLAGTSLGKAPDEPVARWQVSRHALWFVAGCGGIFILLCAAAAGLGGARGAYQQGVERVGGLLLIVFGLALTGLVPLPWLSGAYRVQVKPGQSAWWRSGLIGMTFGASWSACTSPILGAILVLTAVGSLQVVQGIFVML